jgi:uncharacterized membrane protein (UPF0127 family)
MDIDLVRRMKIDMQRIFPAVLIALALVALPASAEVQFKRGTLTFVQSPKTVTLQVEVADTAVSRAQGLMHRRQLADNAGMLFIFEETANWSFWMKNTLIPLSIAFLDKNWRVVDIVDMDVEQDPERPVKFYSSSGPYRYALEVNKGFFKRKGLGVGARATFRLVSP